MKKIFYDAKWNSLAAVITIVILIIGNSSIFSLREYEKAAAYQFGEFSRSYIEPGLHFKLPWPFGTSWGPCPLTKK